MTAPKKTDPLTPQEVSTAAEIFFELFDIVLAQSPEGTSIEDALKLSSSKAALAVVPLPLPPFAPFWPSDLSLPLPFPAPSLPLPVPFFFVSIFSVTPLTCTWCPSNLPTQFKFLMDRHV